MERIYLDNAATTRVRDEVLNEMLPYMKNEYGNANSQHCFGREALRGVDQARRIIASAINAQPSEVYFTSGGTESDNWAILGVAEAYADRGKHIITSSIEHHAVLHTCAALEKRGYEITYLSVDSDGFIDMDAYRNALRDDTILVTIMLANNEIGSIQPIAEIAKLAHDKGALVHTDAVQAFAGMTCKINELQVDLMTISGHKIGGVKGVGALYKSNKIRLARYAYGGGQERSMRAGTLNVPGIVAFGKAVELLHNASIADYTAGIASIRDRFISRVDNEIDEVYFNGTRDMNRRLVGNASYSFAYVEGESLLLSLDMKGIAVSSGSACSSGSLDPSHVLLAIGREEGLSQGTIRFSFGADNTIEQVDKVVDELIIIVRRLRELSPLFNQKKSGGMYV